LVKILPFGQRHIQEVETAEKNKRLARSGLKSTPSPVHACGRGSGRPF
jgi:hypothetical protein